MNFLNSLFSEKGGISMMRVMSLLCVIAAIAMAFVGMNKPNIDYSGLSMLCGTFLGLAFGGKVMQKRTEVDGAKSDSTISK